MNSDNEFVAALSVPLLDDVMSNDLNDRNDGPPYDSDSWNSAQIMAMLSNFSTSFNVVNISLVLPMLSILYPGNSQDSAACASSLLAGMMVGQLLGGALGDGPLGRLGALRLVMALQIGASLASSLVTGAHVYMLLAMTRFVLGVGAGGVYPLAAVLSAEQLGSDKSPQGKLQQLNRVVLTFSMQGLGFLAVPMIALPLLQFTDESQLDIVWRVILGFGSVPGIILMGLQWRLYRRTDMEVLPQLEEDLSENVQNNQDNQVAFVISGGKDDADPSHDEDGTLDDEDVIDSELSQTLWMSLKNEPQLCNKLLGTAGTWFLFDVLFYGNTLFQPIVMEATFGGKVVDKHDELKKAATDSLILALIALPGYVVSALVIGKRLCYVQQTPRYVQLQGFFAMALLYAIIGSYWAYLKTVPSLLVLIYGMTFFFANYGPNTTTFVFPSLVYSHECRSTLNGVAAAAGKAGALLGATLFAPAADTLGDSDVMLICSAISVVAFGFTYCFARMPNA